MKKLSVALLLATLAQAMLLSACNTTEGVGKDVKSAGKAVENTARDAKN
jgi:predicted small secreted protein